MTVLFILGGAFVLGLATAISPCPLSTNIAAISFLSRDISNRRKVLLSAGLYTLGRTLAYVILGVALLWAFRAATGGAGDLDEFSSSAQRQAQRYGYVILGPIMLFIGMIMLRLIELNLSISVGGSNLQERVAKGGAIWALPLGVLFALAFCPPSATWFLSALIISLEYDSLRLPPIAYGIGTAVPVIAFALVIAFAGQYVGKTFNATAKIEWWFRAVAGVIFIAVGLYFILTGIYGLPSLLN